MKRSTPAPRHEFPDADALLRACLAAVDDPGTLLTTTPAEAVTTRGLRVRFTTFGPRQAAFANLRALGYSVHPDSRPIHEEHGEAILVTGWNDAALAARAYRAEQTVAELVVQHDLVAGRALATYRSYVNDLRYTGSEAERYVLRSLSAGRLFLPPLQRTERCDSPRCFPVADADRRVAPEPTHTFLERVAIAEGAMTMLARAYADTLTGAIRLYHEYRQRHGYSDENAAILARREACEANSAFTELSRADLESRDLRDAPSAADDRDV